MAHVLACPKTAVSRVMPDLPVKYIEALEQNQQIASCCRHPENHEIEAFYSCEAQAEKKDADGKPLNRPDIYIFHCTCGRKHRRLCVGGGDYRPFWR